MDKGVTFQKQDIGNVVTILINLIQDCWKKMLDDALLWNELIKLEQNKKDFSILGFNFLSQDLVWDLEFGLRLVS